MKAILIVDIPDNYEEYGSGDWFICGDNLRIMYEQDVFLINYKYINNGLKKLKPMPEKYKYDVEKFPTVDYENGITVGHNLNEGWNACIDEIIGEEE